MVDKKNFKVLFIDLNNDDVFNHGVRSMHSYLKREGIFVDTVYLTGDESSIFEPLPQEKLNGLLRYCGSFDVIGLSILSHHMIPKARQISDCLRKEIKVPFIWGGNPVICDPHYFLGICDYVCLGEGEYFMLQLCEKMISGRSFHDIENLGYKDKDGKTRLNPVMKFVDVKSLPPSNFDLDHCYVIKDRMVSFKESRETLQKSCSSYGYRVFPIRGCAFSCTYCSNNVLKEKFKDSGKLIRSYDLPTYMKELEYAKEVIPGLKKIIFYEDDFFVRTEKMIEELCVLYKEKIDLPVQMNATFHSLKEKKLEILNRHGVEIKWIRLGLQSGSEKTSREIFGRRFDSRLFKDRLELLFQKKIPAFIDMISENPFETNKERCETVAFLHDLLDEIYYKNRREMKKLVQMRDHKLMYYPGTQLYYEGLRRKFIDEGYVENVLFKRSTLRRAEDINLEWITMYAFNNAHWIPARLILKVIRFRWNYRFLNSLIFRKIYRVLRFLYNPSRPVATR